MVYIVQLMYKTFLKIRRFNYYPYQFLVIRELHSPSIDGRNPMLLLFTFGYIVLLMLIVLAAPLLKHVSLPCIDLLWKPIFLILICSLYFIITTSIKTAQPYVGFWIELNWNSLNGSYFTLVMLEEIGYNTTIGFF